MMDLYQRQLYEQERKKIAETNELFLEFVDEGMTREQLAKLITHRPILWGRFASWLNTLPTQDGGISGAPGVLQ